MMVTNPTITTLTVTWNPADGNVQGYKVIYVPEDGGQEIVVGSPTSFGPSSSSGPPLDQEVWSPSQCGDQREN